MFSRQTQDRRLVVVLGCERAQAHRVGYAGQFNLSDPALFVPIGINCHLCPRQACSQRAHQPLNVRLRIDADRRGRTRHESRPRRSGEWRRARLCATLPPAGRPRQQPARRR